MQSMQDVVIRALLPLADDLLRALISLLMALTSGHFHAGKGDVGGQQVHALRVADARPRRDE